MEHTMDAFRYAIEAMAIQFQKISRITMDFNKPPDADQITEDADFEIIDPKQLPAPKTDKHDPPGDCGGISHPF
jgi:hypothetical protein